MLSYVLNCVNDFINTFCELAALPIRVFIIPSLENYGIINPIIDAVEMNLMISAIMLVLLGNLCLVNVLLRQISNYISSSFKKKTNDDSTGKNPSSLNVHQTEHKPSSPFYRTRIRRNKEDKR